MKASLARLHSLVFLAFHNSAYAAGATNAAGSRSAAASTTYESVRALDQYGQAVQLKHAAAAVAQGRLIIAIRRRTCVWIVSPSFEPCPAHWRQSSESSSPAALVHAITSPEPASVLTAVVEPSTTKTTAKSNLTQPSSSSLPPMPSTCCYMSVTGIATDAAWLLKQSRIYARHVAEDYGNYQPRSLPGVVSQLMRRFWGYSSRQQQEQRVWGATSLKNNNADDDGETKKLARPLGVACLLVRFDDQEPVVNMVESSGIVSSDEDVLCIGKDSMAVREKLLSSLDANDEETDESLERALVEAINKSHSSIQLDIVHASGHIERRSLRNSR